MTDERLEQAIALLSTKHEAVALDTLIAMAHEGKRPHGQALMLTALSVARRIAELEAIIDEQREGAEAQVARIMGDWQASDAAHSEQIAGLTYQVKITAGDGGVWVLPDRGEPTWLTPELAREAGALAYEGDGTQWIVHVWTDEPPMPGEPDPMLGGKVAEIPPDGPVRILPWCYRFERSGETTEQGRAATWGDVFEALYGEISEPKPGDECVIVFGAPVDMPHGLVNLATAAMGLWGLDYHLRLLSGAWSFASDREPQPLDDDGLSDLLSLVMDGHHPTPEQVSTWTPEQRAEAEAWAAAEHLGAADNAVERLPRPAWLPEPPATDAPTAEAPAEATAEPRSRRRKAKAGG